MKQLLAALLLSPGVLLAQKGDFTLKGKIGNLNAPAKVHLVYRTSEGEKRDSAVLTNGAFELKGAIEEPGQAMLLLKHPNPPADPRMRDMVIFYVEKGTITLNSPDSLKKATFSGSALNTDNQQLQDALKAVTSSYQDLNAEYMAADEAKRNSAEFQQYLDGKLALIRGQQGDIYKAFIAKHPKSVVSLDVIQQYAYEASDKIGLLDSMFNSLDASLKKTKSAQDLAGLISSWKATAVGAEAPLFTQNDTLGKPVNLKDFRGKYVLVDFWASWCRPCRMENPYVVAAFNKHKDKAFTILSVSLDQPTGHDAWINAIHKDGLTWTHVSDLKFWDNDVAKLYGVKSVPQNFLLDPQGKIVAKNLRGEELDKRLDELLK
ncbi:TlpA disulfide reductase family protein [Chitinophaga agri]|uniref:AhpC/TSA family protein n=1 Tax=Chitinophaga agri TaxID=2703787 RepID=A0A6B9ZEP8_9BACT|nr:TlpA disulfide reductase family protein [Chitinophaga agri]QHS60912.1 AhpC/TSA family protein [Chitinophaga agri]